MQKQPFFRLLALTVGLLCALCSAHAQAPSAIPYQAVARNSSGNLLQNQSVRLRFSIHDGSALGTVVYQETQPATTNALGLFNLNIGQGTPTSGTFAAINWASGSKFAQVELDPAGGFSFTDMGTTQMLSVPYALYAATSGSAASASETDPQVSSSAANYVPKWNGATLTDGLLFDNGSNVGIGTTSPGQKLDIVGTVKSTGFQMPTGAVNGYLLKTDASGNASWVAPASVFTDTDDQTLSLSGSTLSIDGGNSVDISTAFPNQWTTNVNNMYNNNPGLVGIGTSSPEFKLDVLSGSNLAAAVRSNNGTGTWLRLQNNSSGGQLWDLISTGSGNGEGAGNLLFKDNSGVKMTLLGTSGNVGIGTTAPTQKLDIVGTVKSTGFQMPTGAASGYILQTDASGNASWVAPASLSVTGDNLGDHAATQNIKLGANYLSRDGSNKGLLFSASGTASFFNPGATTATIILGDISNTYSEMKFIGDGRQWSLVGYNDNFHLTNVNGGLTPFIVEKQATSNLLYLKSNFVGIANSNPTATLDVNGTTRTTNLQMTNGAASGYVLQSDASGNASWVAPTGLSITETDPQVGSSATNYVPKWNGTTLTDGLLYDDGTNVGIGTNSPENKLHISSADDLPLKIESTSGNSVGFKVYSSASGQEFELKKMGYSGAYGGNIHLDNDGATALAINLSNNVGIGTSSPSTRLHVSGGNALDRVLRATSKSGNGTWFDLENTSTGGTMYSLVSTGEDNSESAGKLLFRNSNSTLMTLSNTGNFGIGTTSPSQKLDVSGTTKTTNFQMTNGATNGYVLQSDASGNASWVAPTLLSTATPSLIQDSDANTKIQAGTNSSDDQLHFTMAGTKYFSMDGPRLSVENSGRSVFVGQYAGGSDDLTDNDNTFVGTAAGGSNTSGENNTAIGSQASNKVTTGSNNVSLGYISLYTNLTGSSNTAIGSYAGRNATGSRNLFLGFGAGYNETGSDKLYIDNSNTSSPLIWGDFSSNYVNINGNLGIGTTSPSQKLDVSGTTKTTNFQLTNGATNGYILQSDASGNASWVAPSGLSITETDPQVSSSTTSRVPRWTGTTLSDGTMFDNGTNVGIGNSSPVNKLDVEGGMAIGNTYAGTSTAPNNGAIIQGDVGIGTASPETRLHVLTSASYPLKAQSSSTLGTWIALSNTSTGATDWNMISTGSGSTDGAGNFWLRDNDNVRMAIKSSNGNVGIGTTSPANKLDVEGGIAVGSTYSGTSTSPTNGAIIEGNVGIGTSSPSQKLDVSGTTKTTNFQLTNGATNGYVLQSDASGNASWVNSTSLSVTESDPQVSSSTSGKVPRWTGSTLSDGIIYDNISGVGIGTNVPINKLDVEGSVAIGPSYSGDISAPNNGAIIEGNVGIGTSSPDNKLDVEGGIAIGSSYSGSVTAPTNGAIIEGNVGIGTSSPQAKLDVNGSAIIDRSGTNTGDLTNGVLRFGGGTSGEAIASCRSSAGNQYGLDFYTSSLVQMSITREGNVGIGTTTPTQATLVVDGSESTNIGGFGYLNDNGNTGTSSGTHSYSIYASNRVAASEFNAHSDARIKHIRGRSDNAADLETLMQLKITDYTLIDTVAKGTKLYKKVIAQEVERVYPQAVSAIPGVAVPDIYQLSKMESGLVALPNSGLKVGERVKLIFGEKQEVAEVTSVSEKGFQTNLTAENGQVFVFGREVSDFRTVDYEALSMLNISATQELVKRLADLEKQNAALQGKVNEMDKLNTRMDALEAMLKTSANR